MRSGGWRSGGLRKRWWRNGRFCRGRFDVERRRNWESRWSDRRGRLGNFERRWNLYRNGGLDGRGSRGRGLSRWSGRTGSGEAGFEFVEAGFKLVQVFEAGFEFIKGFDDAGETLIVLLAVDAGLHPAIEGPHGKNEDPELHGTSGRGLQAMLLIERVYRELLAGSGILGRVFPGEK